MTPIYLEIARLLTQVAPLVLIDEIQHGVDADERRFLMSLLAGEPEWRLLGVAHIEQLPGVRWKMHNLLELQSRPRR